MNNWDRIVELFNGANRSVFTKLQKIHHRRGGLIGNGKFREMHGWRPPKPIANLTACCFNMTITAKHVQCDSTVELKLTTVFVEYGGGSSKSTVDTTKHTRSVHAYVSHRYRRYRCTNTHR